MRRGPVQNTRRAESGLRAVTYRAYALTIWLKIDREKSEKKNRDHTLLSSTPGSWVLIYISSIIQRIVWKTVEKN